MRNFTKKFALLILGLSLALVAEAQEVSGTVKDSTGAPVIGASIVVDGTSIGTSTGVSGEWSLTSLTHRVKFWSSPISV